MNWSILIQICHLVRCIVPDTTDYCLPGESTADIKPLSCGSCSDRCGQKATGCSCDIACVVNRDCCIDFKHQCPVLYITAMDNSAGLTIPELSCVSIRQTYVDSTMTCGVLTNSLMLTKCFADNVDCEYNFHDVPTIFDLGGQYLTDYIIWRMWMATVPTVMASPCKVWSNYRWNCHVIQSK